MSVDLSPEVEKRVRGLVESGRFASVEAVVVAGLDAVEDEREWKNYAIERIDAGLADVEAGRGSSVEEVMGRMRHLLQKTA